VFYITAAEADIPGITAALKNGARSVGVECREMDSIQQMSPIITKCFGFCPEYWPRMRLPFEVLLTRGKRRRENADEADEPSAQRARSSSVGRYNGHSMEERPHPDFSVFEHSREPPERPRPDFSVFENPRGSPLPMPPPPPPRPQREPLVYGHYQSERNLFPTEQPEEPVRSDFMRAQLLRLTIENLSLRFGEANVRALLEALIQLRR